MLVEDVDGCSDLFTIEPDDMFLQPQSGHLLQSALIAVLHEDVHLLLQASTWKLKPSCFSMCRVTIRRHASYPMELDSEVSHQVRVFNAFKYLQLICSLLDCFVIIRLESDLEEHQTDLITLLVRLWIILKELILLECIPPSWPLALQCPH